MGFYALGCDTFGSNVADALGFLQNMFPEKGIILYKNYQKWSSNDNPPLESRSTSIKLLCDIWNVNESIIDGRNLAEQAQCSEYFNESGRQVLDKRNSFLSDKLKSSYRLLVDERLCRLGKA